MQLTSEIYPIYMTHWDGRKHEVQSRYRYSDKKIKLCVKGRRARGTRLSMRMVLVEALREYGYYWHTSSTYAQSDRIFTKPLEKSTRSIRKDYNKSKHEVQLINDSRIMIKGLDPYESLEGVTEPPIKLIHVSEVKAVKPGLMDVLNPLIADTNGKLILESSAKKGVWEDIILDVTGGYMPNFGKEGGDYWESENIGVYGWPSTDVLTPEQMEISAIGMDEKAFRREYLVSFESEGGLAYYNFGKQNIRDCQNIPNKTIHIGMDFNVDFMSAALFHLYDGYVEQFGEIRLGQNGNTDEMIAEIKRLFPRENITVYPDAAGNQRQASAKKFETSIKKLRDHFRVVVNTTNPYQSDRLEMVNGLCKDYYNEIRYFVNPKCENTIRDRDRVEMDSDGSIKKSSDYSLGHMSDASDYFLCKIYKRLINREKKSMDMKFGINKTGW